MNPAAKRYGRWFTVWMILYSVAVLFSASYVNNQEPESMALRLALAILPVLPALMALREYIILFRSFDEVQTRIESEAFLISMGVVGFGSLTWGFIELWMELPRLPIVFILPALITCWSLARLYVARRFR